MLNPPENKMLHTVEKLSFLKNIKSRLQTLEGSKAVFAEIIEHYGRNEITENNARCFATLFNTLLSYHKQAEIEEILKRLEALEATHEGN